MHIYIYIYFFVFLSKAEFCRCKCGGGVLSPSNLSSPCFEIWSALSRRNSETPTTATSPNKYANTPPFFIAIRLQSVWQCFQCSSHLYCSTPPICIAICLLFASQCFRVPSEAIWQLFGTITENTLPFIGLMSQWWHSDRTSVNKILQRTTGWEFPNK